VTHLTRQSKTNPRNPDGSFKTIGQMMKATMTVLQYGKYLSQTVAKGASN
jgi:hypothetical protein